MSGEASVSEAQNPTPPPQNEASESNNYVITKQFYRTKVWDHLEKNRLVNFPRPAFGRIPNFKGADVAAGKLLELEEFKSAKTVEVNPDKPLEAARAAVIENNKILYVPIPKLQEGLLKRISFCDEDRPDNIKQSVSRWGLDTLGKAVGFGDGVQIDLLIVGTVAVSKNGHRIGKGRGYADLEFAILKEMKAINDDTVIVTTVHDSQVFDTLPGNLFKKHDVPVDYILTPTQIIKIEKRLPRPEGIYWDLLSPRKLKLMPILQKIKEIRTSEGKEINVTAADTDVESEDKRRQQAKPRRFTKRRPRSETAETNGQTSSTESQRPRKRRFYRRSRPANAASETEDQANKENEAAGVEKKKPPARARFPRRFQVDFSLVVSNIDRHVRVRTLKDALIDHGIKPNNITWRGYKGFCYLHYAKPQQKVEEDKDKPFAVDNVIEILQTLRLNSKSEKNLSVKVMEPITRIETTDVTAV